MANSIQPVIMTADLNRLLAFYTELLGATQTSRVPEDPEAEDGAGRSQEARTTKGA